MGSQTCRNVGESQPVPVMNDPIIFTRTRSSGELLLLWHAKPRVWPRILVHCAHNGMDVHSPPTHTHTHIRVLYMAFT
jgi:hypothetical protein